MAEQKMYISDKGMDKLLKKERLKYHHSSTCRFLCKPGTKVVEITEQEVVDAGKLIEPCRGCCKSGKEKAPKANVFPRPETVTIWHCSDGSEHTKETDALWHELNLAKRRLSK